MASEDRFKQTVVTLLARRSASRCANPDCGAITSGPTECSDGSVNVGEAAHIFGASPGSARYDADMASGDRSAITNAVWLCGNCHKLVDDDPLKYPAGLLFEWQRAHERRIAEQIGKAAAEIRQRYEQRHLEEFGKLTYLAERLILEKGDFWEYHLTAEVLRSELAPVIRRWQALKDGLYVKPTIRIEKNESFFWFSDRISEIRAITRAFCGLTDQEMARAWGEPGVPGDDMKIVHTCRLYAEICSTTLLWEESVRFTSVDEAFSEARDLCIGVAGNIIDQISRIPSFIAGTLAGDRPSGTHTLSLTVELPEGWAAKIIAALQRAKLSISE